VGYSATDGNRRTPAQSEPNDEKHGQYRACSYGDALEKPEKKNTQSHGNIVRLLGGLGEITMVILTLRDGALAAQQGFITMHRTVSRNCPIAWVFHFANHKFIAL
jgi:hypothetical protein